MMERPVRVAQVMGKMENGGVEAVVMNYYRYIDRNKIQFDFIVDNDSTCPQEQEIVSLGGKVIRIAPYQQIVANMRDLKHLFQKNKYKIVHAELTTMSVFSLAVAKNCGVPVRICHGHNTACKGEIKKNLMKYMLRPFSKTFATHYFACSQKAGIWLFGKRADFTVVHNAIDTQKFRYDPKIRRQIRKELQIENKFVVGHIGRFVYQKNHDFLIDVFYEVHQKKPDSVLLLAGEGPLLETVRKKVESLGLTEHVQFLGVREDAYRLYQGFDVFVLTSRYEGLPIVGVEAQISGLPCVMSDAIADEVRFAYSFRFLKVLKVLKVQWADEILAFDEKRETNKMENAQFDIVKQAERLEKIYQNGM